MHNLNWEEARIKRQIKFHNTIGFRVISKIIMNPKYNSFTITELHQRFSFENLRDFEKLFWMAAFKLITADKDMLNAGIKVTIIASIDVILMFLI